MAAQVRHSIAAEESKFKINRQVAALSRANPGVSSAFLSMDYENFATTEYMIHYLPYTVGIAAVPCENFNYAALRHYDKNFHFILIYARNSGVKWFKNPVHFNR